MAQGSEFSVTSVVEDVLQQHGNTLSDVDLESREANEASIRRYEATGWLRKMVGVVWSKNLPAQPSEEEFRLGLRSGIILCNVLNKIEPGSVPKVVAPVDTVIIPDGAALSTFQYFENVRNFLVAVEELGIPKFEVCDLEKGGKIARIVNSVLALKSYSEWKEKGGQGQWKFGGNLKPSPSGQHLVRKNSEPFMSSLVKTLSMEKSPDYLLWGNLGQDVVNMGKSRPLHVIVREFLTDKKSEEVPIIVENLLSKVSEEFESRLAAHIEELKATIKDMDVSSTEKSIPVPDSGEMKTEQTAWSELVKEIDDKKYLPDDKIDVSNDQKDKRDDGINPPSLKQQMLVEQHHKNLQVLKHTVSAARADMQILRTKYQEEIYSLGTHLHTLAHAASGYQKVLEENRKLYNQVQDLKGSIRVYCRVRPFLPGEENHLSAISYVGDGQITVTTPPKYGKGRKSFTFNQAFGPSASQEEVFSDMHPLVRSVLDGYNVCIFAYGQTGSGKTFTMSGPTDPTEETLGVNYRALGELFLTSEQRKNVICYEIFVQMIEIYNEQVRDLLVTDGLNKKLDIRNSSQKGINVPDANIVRVASTADVINLMNIGQKNRAVGSTAMNDRSSRSHSCLTVHVQGKDLTSGSVLRGCMHLVDLAGSERADKTEAVGDRLKEAQHINKSLSALGDVIAALAQKNAHVPYRNSKLTQLLQDSLGGQAKTLMFVHISPEIDAIGETISTLKFAERVSTVELGAARMNKDGGDVKELKEQIANLKAALAKKEAENQQQSKLVRMMSAGSSYPSPTPSRESVGDSPYFSKENVEDLGDVKDSNNLTTNQEKQGFELPEIIMPSTPWQITPVTSPHLNGKGAGSGKWVDKVKVIKQNNVRRVEIPTGKKSWGKPGQSPEMSPQRYARDHSAKVHPEQSVNQVFTKKNESPDHEMNRTRCEATTTDESDDQAAASDCSEPDFPWQLNVPKPTNIPQSNIPSVTGSKLKRTTPRHAKSPEIRSSIPQPLQRRLSTGGAPKSGRQPASVDGKRRTGSGK